ncbi:MAG: Jag N-terminal domain-containing protein [Arcobacteraceae bacterium]|nr:Jag N-terminal domain-containing protein [Arcobacteraceae bacterium]
MSTNEQNSIAFEGKTLEEAYKKASLEFNCSITDLKSEIIQAPSYGFLGFFKKYAIIKVYRVSSDKKDKIEKKTQEIHIEDVSSKIEELHSEVVIADEVAVEIKTVQKSEEKKEEKIFNDFYSKDKEEKLVETIVTKDNDEIIDEISEKLNLLFSNLCYEIDPIKVSYYDERTIYIEFSGEDSALLIGKEGYRYKALSYIIFNWIHDKYDLMVRLEVAQFLAQQEEAIHKYLEPVIQTIKDDGFYKTKQLDGILVHIALTRLRDEFPDKYVAVKTNIKGDRYILVNEYRK